MTGSTDYMMAVNRLCVLAPSGGKRNVAVRSLDNKDTCVKQVR